MAPNESSTENRKCRENQKSMPNSIIPSSAFLQTPFAHPFFRPSLPKPSIITHPHSLIISTADKFFAFIQSLASQNPLIRKFHSLSSELHSFCHQVGKSYLVLCCEVGICDWPLWLFFFNFWLKFASGSFQELHKGKPFVKSQFRCCITGWFRGGGCGGQWDPEFPQPIQHPVGCSPCFDLVPQLSSCHR